jgi:hypothetical protein
VGIPPPPYKKYTENLSKDHPTFGGKPMKEQKLRLLIDRQKHLQLLIVAGLLIGAIFTWWLTYSISYWLGTLFQSLAVFLFSEQPFTDWIPTATAFILLVIVALAGFTRDHSFLDLSGWAESDASAYRVGHFGRPRPMGHAALHYTFDAYILVEILLIAPLATREAIAMLRTRFPATEEEIAQAAKIHEDLQSKGDWVPRGRYHRFPKAVDLLAHLQLIRQTDIRGVPSIRTPSGENEEPPIQ